jgi:hypothetical protein
MCLEGSLGLIDSLPASPHVSLEVFSHSVGHGERTMPRIVSFLSPRLRSPPIPSGLLRLPVVKYGYPVSVLQIVRGADPVLCISAIGLPTSREPRTPLPRRR